MQQNYSGFLTIQERKHPRSDTLESVVNLFGKKNLTPTCISMAYTDDISH